MKPPKKLNDKHREVLRLIANGMAQGKAWAQVYGVEVKAGQKRCENMLQCPEARPYLAELRKKADDAAIADLTECCKVLTEVIRGSLGQYVNSEGYIEANSFDSRALQEVTVTDSEYGRNIKIKLRDPIQAIGQLSKLKGWDSPQEINHNVTGIIIERAGSKRKLSLEERNRKASK